MASASKGMIQNRSQGREAGVGFVSPDRPGDQRESRNEDWPEVSRKIRQTDWQFDACACGRHTGPGWQFLQSVAVPPKSIVWNRYRMRGDRSLRSRGSTTSAGLPRQRQEV